MSSQRATAFVPGHVTAFFSAHRDDDPTVAGSRGAGVTLTDGVTVRVSAADDGDTVADAAAAGETTIDGEVGSIGAVDDVLAELDATAADVAVETDLPIGAGFGVSGAAALGAALAANDAFDRGRSENELVRVAHAAEVDRGTGLGDVVAQARGGVPVRLEPGAPGVGELDGVPASARVEYVTFGELSTEEVLGGDTDALSAAGEDALDRLRADPRLPTLMDAARGFAGEADLLVPEVAEAIDAVDAAGGEAAMAMLGRTVFALGTGLSDAGYDPEACRIDAAGARLVDD
ncbi:pantoate kinase [Halorubrum ezzemoulense]|uniref:Pantoate kinase n=1 Tax=Halorubrum ezzemoulense TaxID=337243 RepID=A0A256IX35_HALEZ|nr:MULTISPECIES: pantoate kinase [Halorubrum]MDB2223803.1 pantoate kinase [Halorubrum ezzemoulense]MDB2244928.1 pantoate kinase [Halorubrum ezzemoulense]MDB2251135.1 pantoate kinase [Halorubrum ezzemoulense]MDB2263444.1 pantoate kinase [Halorubrum ezzemoulense]MDB2278315.1 pantoate kinase [Halorubrum ezzemoulense]